MQIIQRISASLRVPSRLALAASLIWIPLAGVSAPAQTSDQVSESGTVISAAAPVVPQQVRYAGKLANRAGDTVEAVFSIYANSEGGEPLWTETQKVTVDADGSYSVLLGSATQSGLPQTLFAGGAARWLGISVERAQELPRVLLSSVPYAMKSADAQALAGHPAGDFVTQEQLSQFAQTEAQRTATNEFQPLTNGTITGSGTAGTIAQFTGANTIGNSLLTQNGSMIGINEATPVATLDVNGGGQFRGTFLIPAKGTATTTASQPSQDLEFAASGWSTTTAGPVTPTFYFYSGVLGNNTANPTGEIQLGYQLGTSHNDVLSITGTGPLYAYGGFIAQTTTLATTSAASNSPPVQMNGYAYSTKTSGQVAENFAWQVIPTGNDTATPSANLNLLYGTGSTSPTGLSISSKGIISWATGQTFPITGTGGGTITGITTTSPLIGSGTSGSVALGLNTSALETTLNGVYPQLSASNTFTTGQTIEGASSIGGTNNESGPMLHVTNSGGSSSTGILVSNGGQYGVGLSSSASTDGWGIEGIGTQTAGSIGVLGFLANSGGFSNTFNKVESQQSYNAGVWADGADGQNAALIATADAVNAGVFINNSGNTATIEVFNENFSGPTGLPSAAIATALRAGGPGGICGINQTGNLSCTGQMKSVVSTENGARQTETYAVQSAENWIEDYGSGQLSSGSATVTIESAFAETVNTGVEFHVFLTPGGDCKGLYVTNKTTNSFEVHELGGGTSSIPFDYKIVAKRRGFEAQRLVDVTERMRVEAAAATRKPLAQPLPRAHYPTRPAMGAAKHSINAQ